MALTKRIRLKEETFHFNRFLNKLEEKDYDIDRVEGVGVLEINSMRRLMSSLGSSLFVKNVIISYEMGSLYLKININKPFLLISLLVVLGTSLNSVRYEADISFFSFSLMMLILFLFMIMLLLIIIRSGVIRDVRDVLRNDIV